MKADALLESLAIQKDHFDDGLFFKDQFLKLETTLRNQAASSQTNGYLSNPARSDLSLDFFLS